MSPKYICIGEKSDFSLASELHKPIQKSMEMTLKAVAKSLSPFQELQECILGLP